MVKKRAVLTQLSAPTGPVIAPTPQAPPVVKRFRPAGDMGRRLGYAARRAQARSRILDPLLYGNIRSRIRGTAPKNSAVTYVGQPPAPKSPPPTSKSKSRSKATKKGQLVKAKVKVRSYTRTQKVRVGQHVN